MKKLVIMIICFHGFLAMGQLKIGGNSPLSVASDACTTGCTDLSLTSAKISIQNAQADDGTTKGAASFNSNDFNSASGTIAIDYPNAQLATGSQNGFVTYTGTQTFGGTKIFDGNVSLASSRTFTLWNGAESTPSLLFSDNNTGFGFLTSPSNTVFLSFDGVYRFQFLDGEFDMKNGTDFIAGNGKLDLNIAHASLINNQDGGVSVSTHGKWTDGVTTKYHTCTFGGRTSSGTESTPASTISGKAMAEFIGKGYVDDGEPDYGWEHTNRGVFGVYAANTQSRYQQGAFCAIQTTRSASTYPDEPNDHFSMVIDQAGNAGLTYLSTGLFGTTTSTGWGATDDDRFFSIEGTTNGDAGILIQNSSGTRGINIWMDYSENTVYFDNVRNNAGAIIQTRLRSTITNPVIAITTGLDVTGTYGYTNFGTDATPGNTLSVGSTSQFQMDNSGKIVQYSSTIADGELLIGKTSGSTFEKATLSGSSGITVTNGGGSITLSGFGYSEQFSFGQFNPNDATNYYGGGQVQSSGTTAGVSRVYIPKSGTIKSCYIVFDNSGTLGSTESSTISIRVDNTTDYTVSSTVTNDSRPTVFSNISMSVPVTAGQYIEIKWVTPSWATNPTSVRVSGTIYIE